MALNLLSHTQPFVTNLELNNVERKEQGLKDVEILYLEVPNGENGVNEIETIGNIFVGLQKVEYTIKKFNDVELCLTHIHGRANTKIYLILSQGLIEDKMVALKKCSHVVLIYDFSSSSPWIKHEDESGDCDSFNLIFDQINKRHRQFHYDIASKNSTEFLLQNDITDSRLFIKYQLLMITLYHLPETEASKKEFIAWCSEKYSTKPNIKRDIDEFAKDFTSGQAIKWYTRPTFVNRILGRTFATNDLRLIYKTRYFIRHLYAELKELYVKTFAELGPQILVYRGKIMSNSEFDRLKASIGKLVITKSFVSTSLSEAVARIFSGRTEMRAGNVAVIFRMKIDMVENKSKAFAFIGEKSTVPDEDEVLLGPGIMFRNNDIHKQEENMFIIDLIYTSVEEEIEERVIRSNAHYLEGAHDIQSPDAFDLFIANVVDPLDEQATLQPSRIQNNEQNNQTMEPQLVATIQHQTTQQMNEHLSQASASTARISPSAMKHLWSEIRQLNLASISPDLSTIFIIDQSPLDEEELETSNVIIGRILPRSYIYNQRAYKIEITFPSSYPFSPPEVRLLTPIYHPNVTSDGMICLDILQRTGSWSKTTSLITVLKAVIDRIDQPTIGTAFNTDAAQEYAENRAEFDRKALEMARRHGLPRP